MSARRHILKCHAHWFDRIADGSKTAELRKHDRDFQIGDTLLLVREDWPPLYVESLSEERSATVVEATILHVLPASVYSEGLQPGYSMLSLVGVSEPRAWTEADR